MKSATIRPSTKEGKKYTAEVTLRDGRTRTIHFGSAGMSDYTHHHDAARKERYIARHQAREDWTDPTTAGYWSRWALWNKDTLTGSLQDIARKTHATVRLARK